MCDARSAMCGVRSAECGVRGAKYISPHTRESDEGATGGLSASDETEKRHWVAALPLAASCQWHPRQNFSHFPYSVALFSLNAPILISWPLGFMFLKDRPPSGQMGRQAK